MKFTVLGSGASMGTPAAGGFWGRCDPNEPRNHRTRASLLVQSATTNIIVDTSYDLRQQLNRVGLKKLDGVLLTHGHSDHTSGIDDVKSIVIHQNKLMNIYSNQETLDRLEKNLYYLFQGDADGVYLAILKSNVIDYYQKFSVGDIDIETFEMDHGTCNAVGYRFGKLAYSVDMLSLNERSLQALEGIDTWIVDGSGYMRDHSPAHATFKSLFAMVERLKPKMTYISVLTTHMDYQTLCNELPPHIRPAYDGLVIDTETNAR